MLSPLFRVTGNLCCASHRPPESAIEEPIQGLDDGRPVDLLAWSQQPATQERNNLRIPQFECVTSHSVDRRPRLRPIRSAAAVRRARSLSAIAAADFFGITASIGNLQRLSPKNELSQVSIALPAFRVG